MKAVDLGEELVRLGHAVSCQDSGLGGSGGGIDGVNMGSLQRMLVSSCPPRQEQRCSRLCDTLDSF